MEKYVSWREDARFYRIDPISAQNDLNREKEKPLQEREISQKFNEFLKKRLPHGNDTRVIVYDHNTDAGNTKYAVYQLFIDYLGFKKDNISFETAKGNSTLVNVSGGGYNYFDPDDPRKLPYDAEAIKEKGLYTIKTEDIKNLPRMELPPKGYSNPTMKKAPFGLQSLGEEWWAVSHEKTGYRGTHLKLLYDFRGRIVKHSEVRKRALNVVHDFKILGKEAGIEGREEEQKKKNLEHKVTSVIAVAGLTSSLILFSSNITGNVIAELSISASNALGAVLFLLGVSASFLYFRGRRKV